MAEAVDKPEAATKETPEQTPAQKALCEFVGDRFRYLAQDRLAEDDMWFRSGLFNQGYHWLTRDRSTNRIKPMNANSTPMWTMPQSDYFSKTIAINANALGAQLPRVTALSGNYDSRSRNAAQYAESAIDAANTESGMDVMNPVLAARVALWGIGITKETIAFDRSTEDIPVLGEQTPLGQQDVATQPPQLTGSDPASPTTDTTNQQTGQPIQDTTPDPNVIGTERIPSARLKTTLPTPFSIYIPRDSGDANLAKEVYERCSGYRLSEAKDLWPDYESVLEADSSSSEVDATNSNSLAAYYEVQLRRLQRLNYTGTGDLAGEHKDTITTLEGWVEWGTIPRKTQDKIVAEWGDQPSEVEDYAKRGMTRVAAAVAYGIFVVTWKDFVLQWGESPNNGKPIYTFFQWEKDVANPYGKGGLGRVLMPLQRELNRLDALINRALLSNATTKVMMPESQQYKSEWSGDPIDVIQYDDSIGKHMPSVIQARAFDPALVQRRAQIVQEFNVLGYAEGVSQGNAPGGVDSFRGIAYLGAKAEESRGTQRALWEQGHELRAKVLLIMAKRVWNEPRKIKVAGPNGRYGAELLEGADLDFDSDQMTIVQGSSRPKTLEEKLEAFQTLAQGGLIDVADPQIRQFAYETIGMPELNLTSSLQYSKAERDLQQVLDGMQPVSSPAQDWSIGVRIFSDYSLTEEYESLPQTTQGGILAYLAWMQQLMHESQAPVSMPGVPNTGGPPGSPSASQQAGAALAGAGANPKGAPSKVLSKIPGKTATTGNAQQAAGAEGDAIANNVDRPSPIG